MRRAVSVRGGAARRGVFLGAALCGVVLAGAGPSRGDDAPASSPFRFVDATRESGLAGFTCLAGRPGKDHLLDSTGSGVAFLDFDRDGAIDLFFANGWRIDGQRVAERGRFALFRNKGGGAFEDVTAKAGVDGGGSWGIGVTSADFDGDGWTDLLVTCFGPNLLYRNRGDGTFEEVAARVGLATPGWHTGAAFFDADGDSDLDLFIAGYIDCTLDDVLRAQRTLRWKDRELVAAGPFGMKGARDHFFRATSDGKYVEETTEAGCEDKALAFGFTVRAADFDLDGDVDVFVANDSDANYLYRNEGGRGVFKELSLLSGCALNANGSAQAGMGATVGDPDGDGQLDIFVTTFADDSSTLFRGIGGGLFEDVTAAVGLAQPTYLPLAWGCAFADLDCDGDHDLAAANGHIYPQVDRHPGLGHTYRQRTQVFENRSARGASGSRELAFADVSPQSGPGLESSHAGRALAVGDIDDDGDLDLVVTNLDEPPTLLRNESRSRSWITVVPEDARGPIAAVGARVTVTCGGSTQTRVISAGESFLSTHDPRPHFGLGDSERVESVEVRWPDGSISLRENVPARRVLRVRRPEGGGDGAERNAGK